MRKTLASRIIVLSVIYIVVFTLIVLLQFSNSGNFSISAGGMTMRGRFRSQAADGESYRQGFSPIVGGVRIFYAGLEYHLGEEKGAGLSLVDIEGNKTAVSPEHMLQMDNAVRFIFPGGTAVTFSSAESAAGSELQITGALADDIAGVIIPVEPRRSSLVREAGHLAISYSGLRYAFSSMGEELEIGFITLTKESQSIFYRSANSRQTEFDPSQFIVEQVNNYNNIFRNWTESSFNFWNQNPASLRNENDIIAYLAVSLARGNYPVALQNIPAGFLNSANQTYRSSAYIGGMTNAYRSFIASENEKTNLITRLVNERSPDILKEVNIIDWLFSRNNTALANEVIDYISYLAPESLTIDSIAGLLEIYLNIRQWRAGTNNPVNRLTDNILEIISENITRDTAFDLVYIAGSGGIDWEYNYRLGRALSSWAGENGISEWEAVGRSLVISAVGQGNSGALHNIHEPAAESYPRAQWITNEGHWAWTVSQSIRASFTGGDMILAVTFPVNMTHHLIIRGVRPFSSIQIHGQAWRSDPQFERYDSSGWVYYQDEQVLILKLRHRSAVENIRIVYSDS